MKLSRLMGVRHLKHLKHHSNEGQAPQFAAREKSSIE